MTVPRERLSRLSQASLRISESLDVNTVLHEVVESARALTGARYGGITALDEAGQLQDFVTSGLTPEEHQRLVDLPEGPKLFEYFSGLSEPLRLRDLAAHIRSLGFPDNLMPVRTFMGAPMRHRGGHVGNFYLAGKEAELEFASEDEEVLAMFASQAAAAIANARTHRDEQRARANLEALVDTSPVGVVVIDARTGQAVSLNREAKRIVGGLRMPGRSPEQLLEVLSWRRADGREISLEELPLAQTLNSATAVRAEEIVLEVPDGRSVTTLINATPIHSEDGEVESLVVTMQDLAPLEELERLRAEFLGLVSHELRAPLAAIKPTVLAARRRRRPMLPSGQRAGRSHARPDQRPAGCGGHRGGHADGHPRAGALAGLVEQARNTFLKRHTVQIDLPPDLPRVLADRRRIVQVLNNLFSNASGYSPESSPIQVTALRDGVHVAVSVSDEGRGLPADRMTHLFRKFSRIDGEARGRGIEGSGLGLAICKGLVEAHGGRIWAESDGADRGSRFTFTIPVAEEPARGAPRLAPPGPPAARGGQGGSRRASLWWTTTRRH